MPRLLGIPIEAAMRLGSEARQFRATLSELSESKVSSDEIALSADLPKVGWRHWVARADYLALKTRSEPFGRG